MNKITFALAALSLLGLSAFGQTKLDLASQAKLRQIRLTKQQPAALVNRPALKAVATPAAGKERPTCWPLPEWLTASPRPTSAAKA